MSLKDERNVIKANKEDFINRVALEFGTEDYVNQQRQEAAERLGVTPDDISVKMEILATGLCQEGVLVKTHIGRTRFELKLNEKDLGLKAEEKDHQDFLKKYVDFGSKFLISKEYLNKLSSLDSSARRLVSTYGFETQWGMFVPYLNMKKLKEEFKTIKAEYFSVRDEIVLYYDDIRANTAKAYETAAAQAYKLLNNTADEPTEDFVRKFIDVAMYSFPTQKKINDSFYMDFEISFVPLTSFVEEEKARVRLVQHREEIYKGELQTLKFADQAKRESVKAALETQLMKENYKREMIEEIHRDALVSHKKQIEGFVSDVIGSVYGIVYEALTEINNSIEKNGSVGKRDITRITSLIEKLERLNFTNDNEVNEYINQLKNITDTPAVKREEVTQVIEEIAAQSRQVLVLLGCEQRSVRGKNDLENQKIDLSGLKLPEARGNREREQQPDLFNMTGIFLEDRPQKRAS